MDTPRESQVESKVKREVGESTETTVIGQFSQVGLQQTVHKLESFYNI